MSKNILIISGHPDLENNSLANKTIIRELEKKMPQASIDVLSSLYPDYRFDVLKEQEKLRQANVIVFQFPLFWYGIPSILQKWLEDVFLHGFSHGSDGNALHGKKLIASVTTGAPETAYQEVTINDLLKPLKLTASLTGLDYSGEIVTYGVSYTLRNDDEKRRDLLAKAADHAERLTNLINGIR